jgi:hypothetical protein
MRLHAHPATAAAVDASAPEFCREAHPVVLKVGLASLGLLQFAIEIRQPGVVRGSLGHLPVQVVLGFV